MIVANPNPFPLGISQPASYAYVDKAYIRIYSVEEEYILQLLLTAI